MNSKFLFHKALTMCLLVALTATYSMVALASDGRTTGEIVVTGSGSNSETSTVTVNGEAVRSGRTIFSSSTITTPEGAGAIVNLGKTGRIELAPNTTVALSFDNSAISGDLSAGSITVLDAAQKVNVKTASGEIVSLSAGDTASANGSAAPAGAVAASHHTWWVFALVLGGAVAGLVYTAATGDDAGNRTGTGSVPVSGTR
jgi:hypothetical protein